MLRSWRSVSSPGPFWGLRVLAVGVVDGEPACRREAQARGCHAWKCPMAWGTVGHCTRPYASFFVPGGTQRDTEGANVFEAMPLPGPRINVGHRAQVIFDGLACAVLGIGATGGRGGWVNAERVTADLAGLGLAPECEYQERVQRRLARRERCWDEISRTVGASGRAAEMPRSWHATLGTVDPKCLR